ncbi:MAG: hypothetical protein V4649_03700 [Bacteroidota bacterium]
MNTKACLLAILLLLSACAGKRSTETPLRPDSVVAVKANSVESEELIPDTEIIETFSDSTNIGKKGSCKINIIKHRVHEDWYVIVKFYVKDNGDWVIQNNYHYDCNTIMELTPNISDYNNDKLNDLTFISATAARSANEVRSLFIYEPSDRRLVFILNSYDYPNMEYNKELNCIDAFMVHGGTTTVFARIEGDSLIEFAGVHNDNGYRTVYEIDDDGEERVLRKDTLTDLARTYTRYKNYKPLKEYKER